MNWPKKVVYGIGLLFIYVDSFRFPRLAHHLSRTTFDKFSNLKPVLSNGNNYDIDEIMNISEEELLKSARWEDLEEEELEYKRLEAIRIEKERETIKAAKEEEIAIRKEENAKKRRLKSGKSEEEEIKEKEKIALKRAAESAERREERIYRDMHDDLIKTKGDLSDSLDQTILDKKILQSEMKTINLGINDVLQVPINATVPTINEPRW